MKIVIIILLTLSGCASDNNFKQTVSPVASNTSTNGLLNKPSYKRFDKKKLNQVKSVQIETYIPYPGKNKKKNILLSKEYLDDETSHQYFDKTSRYSRTQPHLKIETFIPFPKGYRRASIFITDTDEEYSEESYNGGSNYEPAYDETPTQDQSYQPSPSKHLKPQSYTPPSPTEPLNQPSFVPTSSKHLKTQPTFSAPSKHSKQQAHIPVRSKHSKQ